MVLRQCLPFSDSCFVLFQSDFLVNTSKVYLCTWSTEKTVQRGRRFTFNSSLHLPALVTEDSLYWKPQNRVSSSPRSTVKCSTCGLVLKHKLVSQSTYHPRSAFLWAKPLSDKKFSGLGSKSLTSDADKAVCLIQHWSFVWWFLLWCQYLKTN